MPTRPSSWQRCILDAGSVLVAVSGGADSVYLCQYLRAQITTPAMRFAIVHVNHRTRGVDSDADEDFVRSLAQSMGWNFYAQRIEPGVLSAKPAEDDLRKARLGMIKALATALDFSVLAFGHHANDLAEGFLLAAMRGSGPRGLSAMAPLRKIDGKFWFVRPLLELTRSEIEERLRTAAQPWREDATNADLDHRRNVVRHALLPGLVNIDPEAVRNIAQSARIAADVDAVYTDAVRDAVGDIVVKQREEALLLSMAILRQKREALWPGVLRELGEIVGLNPNATTPSVPKRDTLHQICDRLASVDDECTFALTHDLTLWMSNEYGLVYRNGPLREALRSVSDTFPCLFTEDPPTALESSGDFCISQNDATGACVKGKDHTTASFDAERLRGLVVVRRAQENERIAISATESKSVAKFLQESRIPNALREGVAVVSDDDGILWIPGVARAMRAFVTNNSLRVLHVAMIRSANNRGT